MNLNHNFRFLHLGLPSDVRRLKEAGSFDAALAAIHHHLQDPRTTQEMARCLTVQREIITRLPLDYPLTREAALSQARQSVPDFSKEEFDALELAGRIDWIYIHGEKRYFDRFFETFLKTDREMARRAGLCPVGDGQNTTLTADLQKLRDQGVYAVRTRCRVSLKLKPGVFRAGSHVRAALPLPCGCHSQSDIRIESVSPPPAHIAPETAPQRTILWEEVMEEDHPFTVEFSYTRTARYIDLAHPPLAPVAGEVRPEDLAELPPHIVFSPYLRTLAETLTSGAETALEKAHRIYDFVTLNVKYSFMRAYFGLEDIPLTCARDYRGDCGVMALLFITLCRCAGVPARWESGWKADTDFCGAHDWAQFYAEPYGWLYADPSFGCGAARDGNEERRRHYFGNLDPWRMAANTAFQSDFDHPWDTWRADPYDNQLGEMALDGRGLRYDEFTCEKQVLECQEL